MKNIKKILFLLIALTSLVFVACKHETGKLEIVNESDYTLSNFKYAGVVLEPSELKPHSSCFHYYWKGTSAGYIAFDITVPGAGTKSFRLDNAITITKKNPTPEVITITNNTVIVMSGGAETPEVLSNYMSRYCGKFKIVSNYGKKLSNIKYGDIELKDAEGNNLSLDNGGVFEVSYTEDKAEAYVSFDIVRLDGETERLKVAKKYKVEANKAEVVTVEIKADTLILREGSTEPIGLADYLQNAPAKFVNNSTYDLYNVSYAGKKLADKLGSGAACSTRCKPETSDTISFEVVIVKDIKKQVKYGFTMPAGWTKDITEFKVTDETTVTAIGSSTNVTFSDFIANQKKGLLIIENNTGYPLIDVSYQPVTGSSHDFVSGDTKLANGSFVYNKFDGAKQSGNLKFTIKVNDELSIPAFMMVTILDTKEMIRTITPDTIVRLAGKTETPKISSLLNRNPTVTFDNQSGYPVKIYASKDATEAELEVVKNAEADLEVTPLSTKLQPYNFYVKSDDVEINIGKFTEGTNKVEKIITWTDVATHTISLTLSKGMESKTVKIEAPKFKHSMFSASDKSYIVLENKCGQELKLVKDNNGTAEDMKPMGASDPFFANEKYAFYEITIPDGERYVKIDFAYTLRDTSEIWNKDDEGKDVYYSLRIDPGYVYTWDVYAADEDLNEDGDLTNDYYSDHEDASVQKSFASCLPE